MPVANKGYNILWASDLLQVRDNKKRYSLRNIIASLSTTYHSQNVGLNYDRTNSNKNWPSKIHK